MRKYYRFANMANRTGTVPAVAVIAEQEPATVAENLDRTYPNGDPIPDTLPESYQLSQECSSCAAYRPLSKVCTMYNAAVLPDYWCATWTKIEG